MAAAQAHPDYISTPEPMNPHPHDDPFKNIQWHPVGSNGKKPLLIYSDISVAAHARAVDAVLTL